MKRHGYFTVFVAVLTALILALTGCGCAGKDSKEGALTEGEEITAGKGSSSTNGDESANDKTDGDASDSETVGVSDSELTSEEAFEFKYTDIILDRKLTEGKLAFYFFRGGDSWNSIRGTMGDGDNFLIIAPDGTTMLIDCNLPNLGAQLVYELQRLGINRIDYFLNTHPHIDHLGGFSVLAKNIEIGHVYTSVIDLTWKQNSLNGKYQKKMYQIMEEKGIPHTILKEGDTFTLGSDVQVKVYNPPAEETHENHDYSLDENEFSLLLKFTYKNSSFLVGGDMQNRPPKAMMEDRVVAKYGSELRADVCKVNHHGSGGEGITVSEGWLKTVNPKIFVCQKSTISSMEEYMKFWKTGALLLHTALDRTVLIYTDGDGTYDVQVEMDRTSNEYGSIPAENGHIKVK